jgi:LmbE family N-acetylglucosaminyl deacetylase
VLDLGLLACYAHPDDEQGVSGTLVKALQFGHRVGILMTTRGEAGEIAPGVDATPDNLGEVREGEMRCAAAALGVPDENVFFVGYRDSGMAGTPENQHPAASVNAEDHEAVGRVVRVIREFRPSVLVTFDEHGGYGHPDHIKIHQWTTLAFEAAGRAEFYPEAGPAWQPARLFYASFARSWLKRVGEMMRQAGMDRDPDATAFARMDPDTLGMPDDMITHRVDVHEFLDVKARSLACHASQMDPNNPFARLPADLQRQLRGTEVFHFAAGVPFPDGDRGDNLFAGLPGSGDVGVAHGA